MRNVGTSFRMNVQMGFLSKTNIAGQMISRVIPALKYDNSLYFDHILFDEIVHIDLKNRWYLWISNISLEHRKIALHRKIAYMFQCHTFAPSPLSLSPKNASFTSKEVGKEWSKAQSVGLELLQKKGICVRSLLEFIVSTMWFIRNKLFYLMQDKHHSYLPTIFVYCKKSITQYGSGPEFQFIRYFVNKERLEF